MATIVNTPGGNNDSNAAIWIVGLVVLVLVVLGAIFLLPRLANTTQTQQPAPTETGTDNSAVVPPVVNNYTTINASTTINDATTTNP